MKYELVYMINDRGAILLWPQGNSRFGGELRVLFHGHAAMESVSGEVSS